ncbi:MULTISPECIES: phosphoadenylyl-sulfate reductase [unclassified Pseudovibrio]|uniref:phosphoadenylyl-sulfate reductase n=1 Tax=unclassified Pseudovibrio TaxID=2627060 RepID=UPI0007AE8C86|nr:MULTISPECIES: phosphoadenylyl-sulfate reductase [unclassified Pseudovibrio]KZK92405.1 Phosphoadenosine phosphosulfate reductase [Pseudovibrio sp. W74]KZL10999.1 Phosphoadenosine phosphosulfate reductase [Pseudovibrio sp. Ad14]
MEHSQSHKASLEAQVKLLNRMYSERDAKDILQHALTEQFSGEMALVSSFGADSSVLLHMVSQIDVRTPVLFVDTGKLFGETKRYRDELVEQLGLLDVRVITPEPEDLAEKDPKGALWASDTDACCHIRKVVPLAKALGGFEAWISGRKRHQADTRASLEHFEVEEGRIKVNPLANWTAAEVLQYAKDNGLPPHPLVAEGYPSIGCMPCTDKVAPGEDPRSGRWRGQDKTECGIHFSSASKGGAAHSI